MDDHTCKICGKTRDIFKLTFEPDETDANEAFDVPICGTCWEIIAAISRRAVMPIVQNLLESSKIVIGPEKGTS